MAVIDHLVYAVPDLAAAIAWVEESTGVRPQVGGSHDGMGTHNALTSMGSCYLELIAPDPNQPEPEAARPFGIDDLDSAALVTYAVRPDDGDDIEALIRRSVAAGYDPGPIVAMSRTTVAGTTLRWRLTMPRPEFDGLTPFVIDWGATPKPNETSPGGLSLTSFQMTDVEPSDVDTVLAALGVRDADLGRADTRRLTAVLAGPDGTIVLSSGP